MFAQQGGIFAQAADRPIALAVIVPTLNEAANVEPLLERLAVALCDIEWEAIFVDDASTDGTPDIIARTAQADRRVRLVRRFGRRGLSSAVIEGMLASTAPVVAVIDGDLQHDERVLPALFRAVAHGGYDLAVGTRYAEGGSVGAWSRRRAWISRVSTRLAAPLLKTDLSDPMSGFFAIRREAMLAALPRLSSCGYKILLDLVASSPRALRVYERPYTFRSRVAGESKLDSAVALDYAELLLDKMFGRFVSVKFLMFAAVGGFGLVVHLGILGLLVAALGAPFAFGQSAAVVGSMTLNFLLNNSFTYRDRRLKGFRLLIGLATFYAVCGVGAVANVGVGTLIYRSRPSWWVAGVVGALIGSVWNYTASSWLTWTRRRP